MQARSGFAGQAKIKKTPSCNRTKPCIVNHLLQHTFPSCHLLWDTGSHLPQFSTLWIEVIWFPITAESRTELLVTFGSVCSEVIFSVSLLVPVFHPPRLALPFWTQILSSSSHFLMNCPHYKPAIFELSRDFGGFFPRYSCFHTPDSI